MDSQMSASHKCWEERNDQNLTKGSSSKDSNEDGLREDLNLTQMFAELSALVLKVEENAEWEKAAKDCEVSTLEK